MIMNGEKKAILVVDDEKVVCDLLNDSIRAALQKRQGVEQIEAIARGVAAQVDPTIGYLGLVVHETENIARKLGIDEGEIKRWVTEKTAANSQAIETIRL